LGNSQLVSPILSDDACSGGTCVAGAALDCDDLDECTADSCDAVIGCAHEPIPDCVPAVPATPPWTLALLAIMLLTAFALLWAQRGQLRR